MATILADSILEWIFLNENVRILIQISLKFVPKSPIDNKPALVQVMAWRQTGDKPLPEPMMTQCTNAQHIGIMKCILLNDKFYVLIKISLKFCSWQ